MRHAWLVSFVAVPFAVACASGGSDMHTGFGANESTDSGTPSSPDDSGGYPGLPDSGGGPGVDTGMGAPDGAPAVTPDADAPADAATTDAKPSDAGKADVATADTGSTDASSDGPPLDGSVVLGESCASPIDISAGGTFTIDTCTLSNSVATTCGTTAAAGLLRGDAPMSGSTYSITFPTGWVLQELDDTCAPISYDCGSTGTWGVSGATLGSYWYFAIEPASGTCGSVSITVDRIM